MANKFRLNLKSCDKLILFYILIQVVFILVFKPASRGALLLFYLASMVAIFFMSTLPQMKNVSLMHFIKTIFPLILFYVFYRFLDIQIDLFDFQPHDQLFYGLEKELLKVYPTFALQRIMEVWLNEFSYALYCVGIALPIWAIIRLYQQEYIKLFENFILALTIGCLVCLTTISIFPVAGPGEALSEIYYLGIYGPRFSVIAPLLIKILTPRLGSFPAPYFCLLTISAYYLWDFGNKYVILSFVVLIAVFWGGVYLRYHYLADALVALLIAFLAATIASFVYYMKYGRTLEE